MSWRIGTQVRALRKHRRWRQQDLAARLGCSREVISRIENDRLDNITAGRISACIAELGGYLRVDVQWQGERLPRLLDARHAALQNQVVTMFERWGWSARVEVSFNHYGDRGRIDVLGFHQPTGTLAVVEVKPTLGDVQDTLGRLDVKARLGRTIAGDVGWNAREVVPILIISEGTTPRRQIAGHASLFGRYAVRGHRALAWLRNPIQPVPSGLLLFIQSPHSHRGDAKRRLSA